MSNKRYIEYMLFVAILIICSAAAATQHATHTARVFNFNNTLGTWQSNDGSVQLDSRGGQQGNALRWLFDYRKEPSFIALRTKLNKISGFDVFSFYARSDRPGPMFVRFDLNNGAAFFSFVNITANWTQYHISAQQLQPAQPGQLFDAKQIAAVYFVDLSGKDAGWTGQRSIWIDDISVHRPIIKPAKPSIKSIPKADISGQFTIVGHDKKRGNLVVTAYHNDAAALFRPFVDYSSFIDFGAMGNFLFTTDLSNIAASSKIEKVKYDEKERFIDPYVVDVIIPLNEPRAIQVPYWLVPGYGRVWLTADNAGKGYKLSTKGGIQVLNLNYEFARSLLHQVELHLQDVAKDYHLPAQFSKTVARARQQLISAQSAINEQARAQLADKVLTELLLAAEDLEFELAKQRIPEARMGGLKLTVIDASGKPLHGAHIEYRQISHDFLFGCVESFGFTEKKLKQHDFDRIFTELGQAGFNHFTVSLFWDQLEKSKGKYRFEEWENTLGVKEAVAHGFSLKLHALMQESMPSYIKHGDKKQLKQASKNYFRMALDHYKNKYTDAVTLIQAINEPSTNDYLHLDQEEKLGLIKEITQTIRSKWPGKAILINDIEADYGERYGSKASRRHVLSAYEMFQLLNKRGIDYDAIGLEWYPGLQVNFYNLLRLQGPLKDFFRTSLELDHYAALGKPLHLTEFTVPSSFKDSWKSGWWRNKWDAQTQADYIERFYTLAFSKAHIKEITYWGITDDEPWVISGGLMTSELAAKPALKRIEQLIGKWTTHSEAITNTSGHATLHGFGGRYEVMVSKGDINKKFILHIQEQSSHSVSLSLQ